MKKNGTRLLIGFNNNVRRLEMAFEPLLDGLKNFANKA